MKNVPNLVWWVNQNGDIFDWSLGVDQPVSGEVHPDIVSNINYSTAKSARAGGRRTLKRLGLRATLWSGVRVEQ